MPIRAGKLRILIASLLVDANRLVFVDELVERLWDERPPADPRAVLASYVMRLRRLVDPPEGSASLIHTGPEGYLIRIEDDRLDLLEFAALREKARSATNVEKERAQLGEALSLWRGPALADVRSETLQRDVVPGLQEDRLRVLERRIDLDLELGRHAELVAELTGLTAEHPLRERFWGQLMLALHRSGRQPEALDVYGRLRRSLVDALGLDPSAESRRLHELILAGDPRVMKSVSVRPDGDDEPGGQPFVSLCQLPPDTADFVGRAELVDEIVSVLRRRGDAAVPIVTVTGPPAVGKTTVAVRAGHRLRTAFPDGQLYVRLAGAQRPPRDPSEVLLDLLTASGMNPSSIPGGLEGRAAAFRARLADRAVLLVLDDAAGVEQVLPLLPGTPGCAVLITSRRDLGGVAGAVALRMAEFGAADALDLLAHVVGPDRVAAEPAAARAIVDACGGLPLALRVVGARLSLRPLTKLATFASRLQNEQRRLDELAVGDLEVRASFALSYRVLSPAAAAAFRGLGLIGATDAAAWTLGVLANQPEGERLVEQLLEANLLTDIGPDPSGEPRYRLHDLMAVYAAELARAEPASDNVATVRRYIHALTALADRSYPRLTVSVDNLRPEPISTPITLPEPEIGRLTSNGLGWMLSEERQLQWAIRQCVASGWPAEAARLSERAVEALDTRIPPERVDELLRLTAEANRAVGDERTAARVEMKRAYLDGITVGATEESLADLEACAETFERVGARIELALTLSHYAHLIAFLPHSTVRSLAHAERAVAVARSTGDLPALASTLRELGTRRAANRHYDGARAAFDEALELNRRMGRRLDEAMLLHRLSRFALDAGDVDLAYDASKRSRAIVAELGGWDAYRGRSHTIVQAARVAVARGEVAEGIELAARACTDFAQMGEPLAELRATVALAEALLAGGRIRDVVQTGTEALARLADIQSSPDKEELRAAISQARKRIGLGKPGVLERRVPRRVRVEG